MIHGIIQNGRYFLTDIPIFEDGIIDCWGCVDLSLFKKKIQNGWMVPTVKNGNSLHISELGKVEILHAEWASKSGKELYKFVKCLVKTLNSSMINLYDMKGSDVYTPEGKQFQTRKVSRSKPKFCKPDSDSFFVETSGGTMRHFVKENDIFYYVRSTVFNDETVVISGLPSTRAFRVSEFRDNLLHNDDYGFPNVGARISIEDLTSFTVGQADWFIDREGLNQNLDSILRGLRGGPSLVQICIDVFEVFKEGPTQENLDRLRQAYENVPQHDRMFCGGQDEKDIPIRIALYGEQEIENWSHWQAAKAQGYKAPTINVPKIIEP